ncbi:MAG: beta(1,3)galactosyltransferase EpsH [Lachnospiraceae bacterium]|nr:beta(1,3)galactosyltransferase EpsH [Lachnospiraceae bacterium]
MIFVTLGSQKFQFNRLLIALDEQVAAGKITDEIFAQIGASDYKPQNFKYKDFLNRDEFAEWQGKAEIEITHGGTGAIIGAVKKGKKVIAVPRMKKYGEHVDDHQLQLVGQFSELNLIYECRDCNDIWKAIENVKVTEYKSYQSNTSRIIKSIEEFIGEKCL